MSNLHRSDTSSASFMKNSLLFRVLKNMWKICFPLDSRCSAEVSWEELIKHVKERKRSCYLYLRNNTLWKECKDNDSLITLRDGVMSSYLDTCMTIRSMIVEFSSQEMIYVIKSVKEDAMKNKESCVNKDHSDISDDSSNSKKVSKKRKKGQRAQKRKSKKRKIEESDDESVDDESDDDKEYDGESDDDKEYDESDDDKERDDDKEYDDEEI
jgi:hypothetical protein